MHRTAILSALAVALLAAGTSAVRSEPIFCGSRTNVLERLERDYEERRHSVAITANGRLLEVLTSPLGSWSIIVSEPGGSTCLVANGEGWRPVLARPDDTIS